MTLGFIFVVPICSIVEIATYAKYISFELKIREIKTYAIKTSFLIWTHYNEPEIILRIID